VVLGGRWEVLGGRCEGLEGPWERLLIAVKGDFGDLVPVGLVRAVRKGIFAHDFPCAGRSLPLAE
jgi:hypothetical protein